MFPPTAYGEWRSLDPEGRWEWLARAAERHFSGRAPRTTAPRREIVLDGALFDDLTGFYCAIGEAVNGPGGYFGKTMMGFDDCLFGGFGLEAPCTIRWLSSARSRACLDGPAMLEVVDEQLAWLASWGDTDDFAGARAKLLARAELARRGEITLFGEIVAAIESVRTRAFRSPPWVIDLRLE